MVKVNEQWIRAVEQVCPGFRATLNYYESLALPPCPKCGSLNSAIVSAGLVGFSIHLAAATTKFKLLPNGHPADFHCADCGDFFNEEPT